MVSKRKRAGEKEFRSLKDRTGKIRKDKITKAAMLDEKMKAEMVRDSEKRIPLVYAVLIIIVAAAITWVLLGFSEPVPLDRNPVKEGDIVQIAYVGKLENGSVFDSGNFTFRTGAGEAIIGVEQAVIGMFIGEKKTVTLSPDMAYGYLDPNKIQSIPLVEELNCTYNTTKELFLMSFGEEAKLNELYQIEGRPWPIRVVDITNETVTIKEEAEDGMVFERKDVIGNVWGTTQVSANKDILVLTSTPIKGRKIVTIAGEGLITEVNETHMTLDFNHKLAGETLVFEIRLLNFISYD